MAREYVKAASFGEARQAFIEISLGQTLGFSVIVVASLVIGLGLGAVVSGEYLSLIGAVPVIIGLFKIQELREEGECACCGGPEAEDSLLAKSQSGAQRLSSSSGFQEQTKSDELVGTNKTASDGIKLRRNSSIGGRLLRENSTRRARYVHL